MANKIYKIKNENYLFNFNRFKELFNNKKQKEQTTNSELENKLSDYLSISSSTIHGWRYEKYSPTDVELIKNISLFFNLKNENTLLIRKGEKYKNMLTDIQVLSIKRIYDSIIDFLQYFEDTDGFNDIWFELDCDPKEREGEICDIALKEVEKVILVFKKEYILLKDLEIYKELSNYIYNDLYDIFDGKLSYAYRFEAIVDGNPTTDEDYRKALDKINDIIGKYL